MDKLRIPFFGFRTKWSANGPADTNIFAIKLFPRLAKRGNSVILGRERFMAFLHLIKLDHNLAYNTSIVKDKQNYSQNQGCSRWVGRINLSNPFKNCFAVCITIALLISTLSSCVEGATATGQTYYISATGSDTNDGLSAAHPWKTIKTFQPGNKYLLKRNEIFYFTIPQIDNDDSKIVLGAYGKGSKPILSAYKNIKASSWRTAGSGLWKADISNPDNYTGLAVTNTNIGFIKVGTSIKGNKLNNIKDLHADWDFTTDAKYLYVMLKVNPASVAKMVRVAPKVNLISLSNAMDVKDIELTGAGAHAITGSNVTNDTIRNVTISDIGGSYFSEKKKDLTRYGNGIQFWNAANCLIENCDVKNVYDAAYTLQSYDEGAAFDNIIFRNNKADRNEFSFEFWVRSKSGYFKKCQFVNNYCSNAGMGWSHNVRPDKGVGVHLLCYFPNGDLTGLTIANNTFKQAKVAYTRLPSDLSSLNMFSSENNQIELGNDVPICVSSSKGFILKTMPQLKNFYGLEKTSLLKYVATP